MLFGTGFLLAASGLSLHAQVSVTTWRNDIARTGQNLNETILNTSNVNTTQFGKLFSQPVDGYVYTQPLYLPNLTIGAQSHNVVFVATEHDSVYAFDADNNAGGNASPLWYASLLTAAHGAAAGATTIPASTGSDIYPEIGITGTPVIDPVSGTLYVVSATLEGINYVQRLHALSVTSGAEKFGGPVLIAASVSGTGVGSMDSILTFDPEWENQRPGLLLLNGIVYVGFAAHEDDGPFHGWILAYNAQTLAQTSAFCVTPNGEDGGIWMGGAGLAAEVIDPVNHPFGRMFVATANGDYTASKPYSAGMDYGDTILNLDLTNGVPTVQDSFTPAIQATEDLYDGDQGAGGLLIVPNQTTGSYPHLLVQAGKSGEVYLLNRENLGGYNPSGDQVVQGIPYAIGNMGTWTMPAYWNGTVYYWAVYDTLKAFSLANGLLTGPTAVSSEKYGFPGANPSISANGNAQGIVWTIDSETFGPPAGPALLQAHNATTPATTLYSSSTNVSRDNPGNAVKFTVPTVANGKVYVGAQYQVSVFGLLSGQQQAASPELSPGAESFAGSLTVSISEATAGATIYYTLDGSTPTVSSPVYATPIIITATTTIQAMATASGYLQSSVTSETYVGSSQVSAPTFSPAGGAYSAAQSVTISDATSGATIYYTTNGTMSTTSSTKYTSAINVSATETLNAIAVETGYTNSPVASAAYTISTGGTSYISYPSGGFTAGSLSLNYGAAVTGGILNLTDGGLGENRTAWFTTKVPVQSFITDFTFQQLNATADGMTFAIQGNNIWSLGDAGGGLGYQGIANSVAVKFDLYSNAGEGSDSTGLYTNGAAPTVPSVNLSTTAINLHSGDVMHAHMVYDGTNLTMTLTDSVTGGTVTEVFPVNIPSMVGGNTAYVGFTGGTGSITATQNVLSWTYVSPAGNAVAIPTFSLADGSYASPQTVTIGDATSGATIYYTTNGTTPTNSSTKYTSAITVSATETLEAIAVETGYTNSPVATAAYTFALAVLPAPTFSPAGGAYSAAQSVSISDATSGATIYYTTNGIMSTTLSTKYTSAITVSASEALEAIAVETGYTNSTVASATYTIASAALPTPTFSPVGGTYSAAQSVTISDATSGATIYYTTNGTMPTTSSTKYMSAITVSATETLEAIAVETGYTNSSIASAAYTIVSTVLPAPTFSPVGGTFSAAQSVTISDATSGATIYYTTNGITPTPSSTEYTSAITVSATETLEAIAVETGYTNSSVASAAYNISTGGTSYISYPSGGFTAGSLSLNYGAAVTGGLLKLTNGGLGENRSAWFTSKVPVQSFITDFTFQQLNATADGMTFAIQGNNIWSLGDAGGGLGYQGIAKSVAVKFDLYSNAGEGSDSTGLYTNGAAPTVPSVNLSTTAINLHSGDVMHAHMVYDGTNLTMTLTDTVTGGTVTEVFPVNIPGMVGGNAAYVGFTGGTGSTTATQNVLSWTYVSQ
jgi:LysM repeat protein